MTDKLQLFNDKTVRTHWDAENEEWYFSVVDVVRVLTDSADPKQYIKKLRARDHELNASWGTICTLSKMLASDRKMYKTTASTTRRKGCFFRQREIERIT